MSRHLEARDHAEFLGQGLGGIARVVDSGGERDGAVRGAVREREDQREAQRPPDRSGRGRFRALPARGCGLESSAVLKLRGEGEG